MSERSQPSQSSRHLWAWLGWFFGLCLGLAVVLVIPGDQGFGVGLLFGIGSSGLGALIGRGSS